MCRYRYLATVDYLNETKRVSSESLRNLSNTLGISVNTIKALINEAPKCRTARKISIERIKVKKKGQLFESKGSYRYKKLGWIRLWTNAGIWSIKKMDPTLPAPNIHKIYQFVKFYQCTDHKLNLFLYCCWITKYGRIFFNKMHRIGLSAFLGWSILFSWALSFFLTL